MANKRIYKHRLKHWNMKPALDKVNEYSYNYRVLNFMECAELGAVPSTDLLKYAIGKFDGEQFLEIVAWFSSEHSATESLKKFPQQNKKSKKKFVRERSGLNTVRG